MTALDKKVNSIVRLYAFNIISIETARKLLLKLAEETAKTYILMGMEKSTAIKQAINDISHKEAYGLFT
jgi:hypothetical protein